MYRTGSYISAPPDEESEHWSYRLYSLADLQDAISSQDRAKLELLLQHHLTDVAVDRFSWLVGLRWDGMEVTELASSLLKDISFSPWVFVRFVRPVVRAFSESLTTPLDTRPSGSVQINDGRMVFQDLNKNDYYVPHAIEILCGIGGIRPILDYRALDSGKATFKKDDTDVMIFLDEAEGSSLLHTILEDMEDAAGILQMTGACRDSFNFLALRQSGIEPQKIDLRTIRQMRRMMIDNEDLEHYHDGLELVMALITAISGEPVARADIPNGGLSNLYALATQFLSLAMLSYFQDHKRPSPRPFFLRKCPERITLAGWSSSEAGGDWPCITGSFHEMMGNPVFVFEYIP